MNTCRSDICWFTFSFIFMVKDSAYFLIRQIVGQMTPKPEGICANSVLSSPIELHVWRTRSTARRSSCSCTVTPEEKTDQWLELCFNCKSNKRLLWHPEHWHEKPQLLLPEEANGWSATLCFVIQPPKQTVLPERLARPAFGVVRVVAGVAGVFAVVLASWAKKTQRLT